MGFDIKNKMSLLILSLCLVGCNNGTNSSVENTSGSHDIATTSDNATTNNVSDTTSDVTSTNFDSSPVVDDGSPNSSSNSSANDLIGCYTDNPDESEALMMIEEQNNHYYVSLMEDSGWHQEPTALSYGDHSTSEMQKIFKEDIAALDKALYLEDGGFALFKIKEGVQIEGKDPNSDYIAFFVITSAPVYKVGCPA